MPLMIGVVVGLLLLVWAGVEVDHFVTAHPAETIFAVGSVVVVATSVFAARVYASLHDRVPLRPVQGNVITAAPVRPEIRPAPPVAPPAPTAPKIGEECGGPGCEEKLGDDPWHCGGVMPDGHEVSGQFCSRRCMEAWQGLMTTRHAGRPSQ